MANIETFIELTNQIFWEGYAEQLAKDNPAQFVQELAEFEKLYNLKDNVHYSYGIGQTDHTNQLPAGGRCAHRNTGKGEMHHLRYA